MAPRSQLEITTSSVLRLVKEEASYHREMQQQEERIKKLESDQTNDDENKEYLAKQEVSALDWYSLESWMILDQFMVMLKYPRY